MLNFIKSDQWLTYYRFFFIAISFLSIVLIVFSYSPFNDTSIEILNSKNVHIDTADGHREEVSLTRQSSTVTVTCRYAHLDARSYCGVVFFFPLNLDTHQFVSFNHIDHIQADIVSSFNHQSKPPRVRMMIRSLINDKKWLTYDESDVKYHAVRLDGNGLNTIPLNRFIVETWWLERYQIPYEQSFPDYAKIVNLEIYINDMPLVKTGIYTLDIRHLKAIGHYLSHKRLFRFFALFWPAIIVLFLLHHTLIRFSQIKTLTEQAFFDTELGVFNLHGFESQLQGFTGQEGTFYIVKMVNLTLLEKHFGESVLVEILAKPLAQLRNILVETPHCIACIDKDEIAIFVGHEPLNTSLDLVLIDVFTQGIVIEGAGHLRLEVKVGMTHDSVSDHCYPALLEQCRQAIKFIGFSHNRIQEYNRRIQKTVAQEAEIEGALREAIQHELFELSFMPIYAAERACIMGAEALIVCKHARLQGVSPERYIPLAEKTGLIRDIDFWVIKQALSLLSSMRLALPDDFVLSINLSSRELLDASFVKHFETLLHDYHIEASSICLEVTETFFIEMDEMAIHSIQALRAIGCLISLDDFGTGYTSFAQLLNLPIDEIKIDKSFIDALPNEEYRVMVDSIIDIAHCHGYDIVVEGIETREQFEYLVAKGCQFYQGYMISRPVSFDVLLEKIRTTMNL